jgi:hypothetical protein
MQCVGGNRLLSVCCLAERGSESNHRVICISAGSIHLPLCLFLVSDKVLANGASYSNAATHCGRPNDGAHRRGFVCVRCVNVIAAC